MMYSFFQLYILIMNNSTIDFVTFVCIMHCMCKRIHFSEELRFRLIAPVSKRNEIGTMGIVTYSTFRRVRLQWKIGVCD